MKPTVEMAIDNLIGATLGGDAPYRDKHLFRESLRGLVRLAKAEQMLEIKTSVERLTGAIKTDVHRCPAKVNLLFEEFNVSTLLQREFEFDRDIQKLPNPTYDQGRTD